jgi:hypothetical protein
MRLIFAHLSGGSQSPNQFSTQRAAPYTIDAGPGAMLRGVGAK